MRSSPRKFTKEEDELIRKYFPTNTTEDVAEMLGVKPHQCYKRAYNMGIHKNPNWVKSMRQSNAIKSIKRIKPYQYRIGNTPSNMLDKGTETVWTDKRGRKCIYVKLPDGRWKAKHHIVWEKAYGDVPTGYIIAFKDGNTMNVTLENLEIVSYKEMMNRNSSCHLPKEIRQLLWMKGALKKAINKSR